VVAVALVAEAESCTATTADPPLPAWSVVPGALAAGADAARGAGIQGNIFHGALALHQLAYTRPAPGFSSYRSPIKVRRVVVRLWVRRGGVEVGGGGVLLSPRRWDGARTHRGCTCARPARIRGGVSWGLLAVIVHRWC
jgi:hypothetical protein